MEAEVIENASQVLEASDDPLEIARWWERAPAKSRDIAWRRLLDAQAFGPSTHDVVTVHTNWKRRGKRGEKVEGFTVVERVPAWLAPRGVSISAEQGRPTSEGWHASPTNHSGIADAYITEQRHYWVDWDWPVYEGMYRETDGPSFVWNLKLPSVFAVPSGGSPEVTPLKRGDLRGYPVISEGTYLQSAWKQCRDKRSLSISWPHAITQLVR